MNDQNRYTTMSPENTPLHARQVAPAPACVGNHEAIPTPPSIMLERVSPPEEPITFAINKETMGYLAKQPDAEWVICLNGLPAGSATTVSATLSKAIRSTANQ
jgi:hypothetical protein